MPGPLVPVGADQLRQRLDGHPNFLSPSGAPADAGGPPAPTRPPTVAAASQEGPGRGTSVGTSTSVRAADGRGASRRPGLLRTLLASFRCHPSTPCCSTSTTPCSTGPPPSGSPWA